jgi:hypothetical protein
VAAVGHPFLSSFGEVSLGVSLVEPGVVVVERSSGRVFVADPGAGVVDVFSSSGVFESQFGEDLEVTGLAVDEATHDVFLASEDEVLVFAPDGSGGYGPEPVAEWSGAQTAEGEFGEVTGVAVDNSKSAGDPAAGDVYVVDSEEGVVDVFKPGPEAGEGAFVKVLKGPKLEEPNGVTVDAATGQVLVADSAKGAVDVYSSAGSFESKITGSGSPQGSFRGPEGEEGNVTALAVEEASGDVLVAEGERHVLGEYAPDGEWLGWIINGAAGPLGSPAGVALAASGDVYVADSEKGLVDVFGAGVVVADATTGAAKKVAKTTAILNGVVDGDGIAASYRFQYGSSEAYGMQTATATAGSSEEAVASTLEGLQAGATYHYRLVTEDEDGVNYGVGREFTTLPAVEGLSTGPVMGLAPTSATLTGALKPKGTDAHYYFEWGISSKYDETTPEADAGAGTEAVTVEAALSGLAPNTTYHYRLLATDVYGTTVTADASFATSGPPRITNQATSGIGHEEATIHAGVDPDELATEYHFEYGESTSYGAQAPLQTLPAGQTQVPVSATITEFDGAKLKRGATYHFRIVASNSAGTTDGPDQTFTTIPPALIETEYATHVTASEATLNTQIDPLGNDTTYYFQYSSQPCQPNPSACTDQPAAPGNDIGAGTTGVSESTQLTGLNPETTYHYRVLATNSLGTVEGPEHTLTTPPITTPFALADNRAWELVSPPNKHGAPIEALTREGGIILAAENGNSVTYVADGPITETPEGNRSPEMQQVLSTRTPAGWASQDLATPQTKAQGVSAGSAPEYQYFTPDLSLALVEPWGDTPLSEPALALEARQKTMYIRDNESRSYLPLVTEGNVSPGVTFGNELQFLTATPDLKHVVLESKVALTGAPSGPGLYEWQAGELQFVSLLPSGAPAHEAELGFAGHMYTHALSEDGSRIVWTVGDESVEGARRGHLYLRDTALGKTIQLDAAQGAPEPPQGSAVFEGASSDDSKIFFIDKQRLTVDSTAEPGSAGGKPDLYECEITEAGGTLGCRLKDLTVDGDESEHANVLGFVFGIGLEGSSVYFVAHGVLAGNENGAGDQAAPGAENLYAMHEDAGVWTTTFIARLSPEDAVEWEGSKHANTAYLTARVSPSGRYLAFMSAASLTGYDNVDADPAAAGARDEEVYIYDSSDASLTCASCNPTGARPMGVYDTEEAGEGLGLLVDRRKVWIGRWLAGNIPGWTAQSIDTAAFQSRYLSDSGRLFFNSADALVPEVADATRPEEVNHAYQNVGVENVYEYEPSGVGSCNGATGSCVSLISSGSSTLESAFMEATPSGDDVFFLTGARLVPEDSDTAFDVYDARVCTPENPCLTPSPSAPPGCSAADACRPGEPPQEAALTPAGTATFSGPGNAPGAPGSKLGVLGTHAKSPKPLTRAEKLARALKACTRLEKRARRHLCEVSARRRYAPEKHAARKPKTHAKGAR